MSHHALDGDEFYPETAQIEEKSQSGETQPIPAI